MWARLPFPMLGLDSDNGTEFINALLPRSCQQEQITYTSCRAYHKNDQAHVEQKHVTAVRQLIGYDRYVGPLALAQLQTVHALHWVMLNQYLPVMHLIDKQPVGATMRKRYDLPRTPVARARATGVIPVATLERLEHERLATAPRPLALRRRLEREVARLWLLRQPGPAEAVAE